MSNKEAEAAFEVARQGIQKMHAGKRGGGAENTYSDAYQALVRLGLQPQLKLKYRHSIHGRQGAVGDHQGQHKRRKIGYKRHVALYGEPPVVTLLITNGKRHWTRKEPS